MALTLYDYLVKDDNWSNPAMLDKFLDYVQQKNLNLYPSQEAAILELFEEKNVILNTPTGSGKSLVALALIFKSLAQGRPVVYTCPIKALVNEKWMELCREFGPDNVGLSTGDATVNRNAPVLCCTAEILMNIALREGENAAFKEIIMDEFHWYSDPDRGVAWQVPLLTMPQARFLLMSATLGDTSFFERELTRLNGRPTITIKSSERPVPLEFEYSEIPLAQTIQRLVEQDKCPAYVVHFTQAEAAENAQNFMSIPLCTKEQREQIELFLENYEFDTPYGSTIKKWLKHGIGLHHAGLLPKYRIIVERLAQHGLLKIICGTDTLGVGINIPIRTVVFTKLCKYDGNKTGILTVREFHQISGRAGRKGFDDKGWVIVQAPEHVIENILLEQKAALTGKKFIKRKPPSNNFINWDRKTFERLTTSPPEPLVSRFQITHGMLLHVLSRKGDGCKAMREIIRRCHEPPHVKKKLFKRAWELFRDLIEKKIVEILPKKDELGRKVRVNIELQENFSMDQTLSLYLIEAIGLLDRNDPNYALNVISLVESILEDPDPILQRQVEKLKTKLLNEMKAEGLSYYERMQKLDNLEHPKPLRDFIYSTFNDFAKRHPWVAQENIKPKSIAREIYENYWTFSDYVCYYGLERVEGLLLRHLNSVHKVLCQTVPENAKSPEVKEIELYLRQMIRLVDSSLLEEWERFKDPRYRPKDPKARAELKLPEFEEISHDITKNKTIFTALIRSKIFDFLRHLSRSEWDKALKVLDDPADVNQTPWTEARLKQTVDLFISYYGHIMLDPAARNPANTYIREMHEEASWCVEQMLVSPKGVTEWAATFLINLEKSQTNNKPWIRLLKLGPLDIVA